MSKMRIMQIPRPNGPFELIEREIPERGAGSIARGCSVSCWCILGR
jgi:hypothetical protein